MAQSKQNNPAPIDQATQLHVLSHDLKQPLSRIRAQAYYLKKTASDSKPIQAAQKIEADVDLLADQLTRIVTLNRCVHKLVIPYQTTVDIAAVLQELATQATTEYPQQALKCNFPSIPIHISIDSAQIKQAIWEILKNAFEYSSDNTSVSFKLTATNDHLLIKIEDQGYGIEEQELADIFTAYYRGSAAKQATTKDQLGIGLTLAQALIALYQGTIKVTSTVNTKTKVKIMLPYQS